MYGVFGIFFHFFSESKNCRVSTVMDHLSVFLRTKFEIDVPPGFLSVYLPHNVPLLMAFFEHRTLLLLQVTTTVPVAALSFNGESCLS